MVAWDPQSDAKIVVYTRVLAMLTASSQESYPYHVNKGEFIIAIDKEILLNYVLDPQSDAKIVVYTRVLAMLTASSQESYPYHVNKGELTLYVLMDFSF